MRISVEYDFKLDDGGYPAMYASTHTHFEGEDTLYLFGEEAKEAMARRVGCHVHLGGLLVERATLKKTRPGCHRMHMDCSLEVVFVVDGSVVGKIISGDELECLRRLAEDIVRVLAFSVKEEIDASVGEWRFSKLNYKYI